MLSESGPLFLDTFLFILLWRLRLSFCRGDRSVAVAGTRFSNIAACARAILASQETKEFAAKSEKSDIAVTACAE